MAKKISLVTNPSVINKAAFPAIDAHNHLWGNWQAYRVIRTMDKVGVISYCDLTGNVRIEFSEGSYVINPGNISDFVENCSLKYPSWSFADPEYPRKIELLKRRDELIRQHPNTTFILPHFGNYAENIPYVSELLTEYPNVYIDFSARIDELGRQPYSSREFFIKHQDRIIFGTDMPANIESSIEMYRTYFRFLETFDESFYSPDYDGTFERTC